jgi:hypothetical protein
MIDLIKLRYGVSLNLLEQLFHFWLGKLLKSMTSSYRLQAFESSDYSTISCCRTLSVNFGIFSEVKIIGKINSILKVKNL